MGEEETFRRLFLRAFNFPVPLLADFFACKFRSIGKKRKTEEKIVQIKLAYAVREGENLRAV